MRSSLILAAALTLTTAFAAEEQLSPYQWQQQQKVAFDKSEKVYAEALKRNGLLAQFKAMRDAYRGNPNHAFRVVFGQYMSWYQTFVGDYRRRARRVFDPPAARAGRCALAARRRLHQPSPRSMQSSSSPRAARRCSSTKRTTCR